MIEHKGVANYLDNQKIYLKNTNKKVYLMQSYAFDTSVASICISILAGNILYLSEEKDKTDISNYSDIGIAYIPPAYIQQINLEGLNNLNYIIVSGESVSSNIVERFSDRLINEYGTTESTVCATLHQYNNGDLNTNIGKPLNNIKIYILDSNNLPVPIGVIGELYIGGAGLARGYLNMPELTTERFIFNPFATESDIAKGYTRLYKTGDLVRWLPDGNIEYIGRNDFQVKIRGYRIELGEIENQLAKIEGIKQSVVLAQTRSAGSGQVAQTNSQYLVGYYVPEELGILSQEDLLNELSKVLPDYMVPSVLVELESLPLTVNGKLDRKALANPEFTNEDSYQAPTSEPEINLCNIFPEVLGLEKVGITDDFFRIGGNSILAIKLAHKISKALDTNINVADIFNYKNVSNISKSIENKNNSLIKPYGKINKSFPYMLMVHPAGGGCEAYQDLTELFKNDFKCIGVDNYNINNANQISDLNELATLYLDSYLQEYNVKDNFYLLGWSLGGQISLEIASVLEARGYRNIKVILLDTILTDKKLSKLKNNIDEKALNLQLEESYKDKGFELEYIENVIKAQASEKILSNSDISSRLKHTQIKLFKATLSDDRFLSKDTKLSNYALSLDYNNIEKVSDNIIVEKINCHHGNIIEVSISQSISYQDIFIL